jgi:hypothetical protein
MTLSAQQLNQKAVDPKKHCELLIGHCNREGFKEIKSNFDSAYQAEYPDYLPDKSVMEDLTKELGDIQLTIVMGTWCGDSRNWVPRFFKILDLAGYNCEQMKLICVDRDKKAPVDGLPELKIEKVPTFIFYRNAKEIGRIVEVPSDLLEKDMLRILIKRE